MSSGASSGAHHHACRALGSFEIQGHQQAPGLEEPQEAAGCADTEAQYEEEHHQVARQLSGCRRRHGGACHHGTGGEPAIGGAQQGGQQAEHSWAGAAHSRKMEGWDEGKPAHDCRENYTLVAAGRGGGVRDRQALLWAACTAKAQPSTAPAAAWQASIHPVAPLLLHGNLAASKPASCSCHNATHAGSAT